jgi:phage shock protein PspC (stress-responsive transcriptional regulator)
MNKTLTFNLNGFVFTIEESGYALLKNYLDEIKAYFLRQTDGLEIVTEIEARIAEKFQFQLQKDKRALLYEADVVQIMAEMGSVADFEAFAEEEQPDEAGEFEYTQQPYGRLYRSTNNRVLAGVANGLADYLQADPSLVRLLFILTTLFFAGFGLILYLVLWIAVPESKIDPQIRQPHDKDKMRRNQRLYRDADEKVIGGVASGIAAYLQLDPIILRLLFILAVFWGGFGVLAYLILWIAMPAAKTWAQKVEMRGQTANLTNIAQVKKQKTATGERSLLSRLLALPIEMLRVFTQVAGSLLRASIGVLRVIGGGLMLLAGAVMGFVLIACTLVVMGHFTGTLETSAIPIPLVELSGSASSDIFISLLGFLVALGPVLMLLYLGFRLLLNRKLFQRRQLYFGGSIYGVLLLISFFMGLKTVTNFQKEGRISFEQNYAWPEEGMPTFIPLPGEDENAYDWVDIEWQASEDSSIYVHQEQIAQGRNLEQARLNAAMVKLPFSQTDTNFYLRRELEFTPDARFRFQRVEATIRLPKNKAVRIHNDLYWDNEIVGHDSLELGELEIFRYTNRGLECISCLPKKEKEENHNWAEEAQQL